MVTAEAGVSVDPQLDTGNLQSVTASMSEYISR